MRQREQDAMDNRGIFSTIFLQSTWKYLVLYGVMIGLSGVFLFPFLWMVSTSLHDLPGVFAHPYRWVPDILKWENYVRAVTLLPFHTFLFNTLVITASVMVATFFSCSLVAYGFSRLNFRGRNTLFSLCLATMMLPAQVTMIPLYILYSKIGWIDTFWPLIVPAFFGSPFYIFLLRQFFLTIPRELDEAALIDGASRLRIYWSIILPLSRPAMATVMIFTFIGTWNDFVNPLIYINSTENATLTLGLNLLKSQIVGTGMTEWNTLMAGSLLVMIPNIVIFFLAQSQFIKGISVGAMKG